MKGRSWACSPIVMGLTIGLVVMGCAAPQAPPAPATPSPRSGEAPKPTLPPSPKGLERVKLQVPTKAATLIYYFLGKDKGLYKEEGIDVDLVEVKAGIAFAALTAGEIDYTSSGTTAFYGALQGLPVKVVMIATSKPFPHFMAGTGVNTAADFKGKTVGVGSIGTTVHYAARGAVKYLGLDPDKDVTYISIQDEAARFAALKAGSIAAAAMSSPFDLLAKEAGFKELVFTGDIMELPSNSLATAEKRIKDNPSQVKGMIKGTLRSILYLKQNREDVVKYLVKELSLEDRIARASYDDVVKTVSPDGGVSDRGLDPWVDLGRISGVIKGEVNISKGVDFTLLKEVQRELGLSK
ncbi:MAG: ABC transporter substrate-binding protein [Chloroflexi bacterium]|nr:ABC transporter substrate-binding protein [Chloroflexota bacterium]